jgi:transaldolase
MRIFHASVTLEDVRWAFAAGLIDGIVATPAVIAAQLPNADQRELVQELSAAVPLPIIASARAVNRDELYKGARELTRLAEQVIVAVPLVEDALPAIKRLSSEGVRVAATLVHNAAQAALAAKAGAAVVTIAVDAAAHVGDDPTLAISESRVIFDRFGFECDLIAAGPASARAFTDAMAAGADGAVLTTDVLKALLQHPLTDRGFDRFLGEISRRPKPRRPR